MNPTALVPVRQASAELDAPPQLGRLVSRPEFQALWEPQAPPLSEVSQELPESRVLTVERAY